MLDLEQYQIAGSTAREIAASAEAAIRDGRLETGAPLPTVRALAQRLGTSPATVNAAYRILRQRGLVLGEGRRGTRVAPRPALRTPSHHRPEAHGLRDLAVGMPDPELLPALGPALARIDLPVTTQLDGLEIADPALMELARKGFAADGIDGSAIAVVGGAFDGIERVLGAHLRPGDRVIIEDPAYVSIRDLLLALGLVAVPVPVDDLGLIPDRLADALAKGAQAAVIVPRAQNPVGAALDDDRADELRRLLEPHPELLLVEDDHAGVVSGAPFVSLTEPTRPHWAVIRSVSKFLHPDLRIAVMAGDETTIARVEGRQALGPRWSSHVLQAIVVELISDPGFPALIERAREAYAERRNGMVEALAARGIEAHGTSGLNVWVPVREEAATLRALQEAGWLVLAGERFRIATPPGIRITISTLRPGEDEAIAAALAAVEHADRPRRVY
ncbi:MAG TPA: aminotransferase class I/II-fold pyridoxal phosphate-dependent enzyme [Solirubrobacteraceae bacterium]|nr:aminotransferase class I/II-fold pyridoxal phosphate-dependent enzyme [Solirubrobacteraceae bacterium]